MSSGLRGFTHLQVHSHYTLLGGTAPVDELAARAAAQGMTRLALTDTNALYGAVAFDFRSPHDMVKAKKSWFFFDEEYPTVILVITNTANMMP